MRLQQLLSLTLLLPFLLVGLLLSPHPVLPAEATLYVGPGGSDSGTCQSVASPCATLVGALAKAPPGATISVAAGQYTTSAILNQDVTITGVGAEATILATSGGRVFEVAAGVTATLRDLTITFGAAPRGGGVLNAGTLTIEDSIVTRNSAGEGAGIANDGTLTLRNTVVSANNTGQNLINTGGGLANFGTATLINSTFRDNSAGAGGGIANNGTLTLTGSTLEANEATAAAFLGGGGGGGALFNTAEGNATLEQITVALNEAAGNGGGIESNGTLTIRASAIISNTAALIEGNGGGIAANGTLHIEATTISGNSTDPADDFGRRGGGVWFSGTAGEARFNGVTISNNSSGAGGGIAGPVTVQNTIVAGNTGRNSAPDCVDGVQSAGANLIGNADGCTLTAQPTDQVGSTAAPIEPLLGPLQANGGPTVNQLPAESSPARDAGNAQTCTTLDQRGSARDGICDIGAVEGGRRIMNVLERVYLPLLRR